MSGRSAHRLTELDPRAYPLEIILESTQENPTLRAALEPLLVCNISQEYFESRKLLREQQRYIDRDRQERRTWLEDVRAHADDLLKNQADHGTLYEVAEAYYSDQKSLTELLGHDINLIEAVYAGLLGTVWRSGLPEDHDIIRTATESRMYHIALPFLAGMDAIDRVDPEQLRQLSEPQMRRALAFYYFTPTGRAEEPAWYGRWIKEAPTVVADVMIRSAMSAIRAGKEPTPFRYGLAYELRDAEIGRISEPAPAARVSGPLQVGTTFHVGSPALGRPETCRQGIVSKTDRYETVPEEHGRFPTRSLAIRGAHALT